MKISFIYPSIDAPAGISHGLAAMSGVLKAHDHEVTLLHVCEHLWPLPTTDEVVAWVRAERPDLVGFSAMSQQYEWICEVSRALRRALPELTQIIGGVHCTMVPDEVVADDLFEYVCVGEADFALLELMNRMRDGGDIYVVPNMRARLPDGTYLHTPVMPFPDLETLPPKDYELFDMARILDEKKGWLSVLTSRGCPYKCTYCFNYEQVDLYIAEGGATKMKDFLRHYPIPRIIREIQALKDKYPLTTIIFDDDLFTLNKKYVLEFCKAYKAAGIGLPYVVNGHVQTVDQEVCDALADSGCKIMKFGLESGSERVRRDVLLRFMTNEQIATCVEAAHNAGLHTSAFVMFGLPHETRADIEETIQLCADLKLGRFRWALFFPFPGTAAYKIANSANLIDFDRMKRMGNYFDGTCLRFDADHNLYLDKLTKLFSWYVNARTDWPTAPVYQELVDAVDAMDAPQWLAERDALVRHDRTLSDELMEKDLTHYTIRYANVMGVRSDFIKWEQAQLSNMNLGRSEQIVYTLD